MSFLKKYKDEREGIVYKIKRVSSTIKASQDNQSKFIKIFKDSILTLSVFEIFPLTDIPLVEQNSLNIFLNDVSEDSFVNMILNVFSVFEGNNPDSDFKLSLLLLGTTFTTNATYNKENIKLFIENLSSIVKDKLKNSTTKENIDLINSFFYYYIVKFIANKITLTIQPPPTAPPIIINILSGTPVPIIINDIDLINEFNNDISNVLKPLTGDI